jgi:ADP-L-glycero-D-manno-heptose 6-epimerase
MKALVTGGAGFIGSNLALELEKRGHSVIVVDNMLTGNKENLKGFAGRVIEVDVSRVFTFDEVVDVIFHEAAITDPRFGDDEEMVRANVKGFENVITIAKKHKAKLVYASTANLYGNGKVPMEEDQEKELVTAYGKSKLQMDTIAATLFDNMPVVGLRYFNVFGPREGFKGRAASMIYHLGKQMKSGRLPRIFKMGEQKRDHIYVKDVVRATLLALDAPSGIYNVGTGIGTSFNELVTALNEVFGSFLQPEYFEIPYDLSTYQANTQADTTLAQEKLGFTASVSLKEGIKEYFEWLEDEE